MKKSVIVEAVRTPFGKFGGSLKDMGLDMGVVCFNEIVKRLNINPAEIDEIAIGSSLPFTFEDLGGPTIAKHIVHKAGWIMTIPTIGTERACCASNAAIQSGDRAIRSGDAKTYLAGGIEYFSGVPFVVRSNVRWGKRLGNIPLEDPIYSIGYKDFDPVAKEVGELALQYKINRQEQDQWALRSHEMAYRGQQTGIFKDEIVPITNYQIPQVKEPVNLDYDEQVRTNTTIEKLSRLNTIYGSPTVTPGNAPGLNDGAAAILMMEEEHAKNQGIKPLATIICCSNIGSHPKEMGLTPAYAIQKALKTTNLKIDDMDLIEINEAFAAVPLISLKELAGRDEVKYKKLKKKSNVNGGAVALGHPVGASGARIIMTLVYELIRRGGGYGVAAICGGMGHGDACIVKVDGK